MWSNNRKFSGQATSYRRLAVALCLSFFLHLFLLGKLGFDLPDINEAPHFIEAQLVSAKPVPARPAPAKVEAKPVVKKAVSKKSSPKQVQQPAQEAPEANPEIPAAELAPSEPSPVGDATPISDAFAKPPELIKSDAEENQAEDAGLIINPNAYQYVETEFDVRTDVKAKIDSSPAGKAKMVYELLPNGEQYQLKSLMQAKGLTALIIPDLLQTSDGSLSSTGLQPQHYLYQFGNKKNKTRSADFDWESKKLNLQNAKGNQELPLTEGTQDILSFMYQFMFVAPLQNMQLNLTDGRKLNTYNYSFEGEETIATKMGSLTTVHLLRGDAEGEEKTELWLALDYQYVPVKIRKTEKEGKVYELLVTSLKTEKPATHPQ